MLTSPALDAPVKGSLSEYCHEWFGYSMVKNFEDTTPRFDSIHKRDGRSDTAWWHRPRLRRIGWQQEALLSQRGCSMLRVCIASTQNVERSLLLLVVSASDIPLHTIKFFSVLFSSLRRIRPCCRPSQTNIRWWVADCAIYTAWSSVTVFVTS